MVAFITVALILSALALPIVLPEPVLAAVAQPDSAPTITNLHVNQNLITSGDICFYGEYALPYASVPDTPADQAYIFRLKSSDNSTEYGAVTPFVYFDNGYTIGSFAFYFEDADAAGLAWETGYTIRISQSPGQFTAPTYWDYVIPVSAYTSSTTQADNQDDMAARVVTMARDMQEEFTDTTFLEQSALGTILSVPEGATYFRGAMPGIQAMAPSLFLIQSLAIEWNMSDNWTTGNADNYTARLSNTWIGNSENATAAQFGITRQTLTGMLYVVPFFVGILAVSYAAFRKTEPGTLAFIPLLVMAFVIGWLQAAITALVFQLCGIYIAYLVFFSRG